jgi:hypothetical protein
MKSGMQIYFLLASYAFRSNVLVIVKNIQDPEKIHPGYGTRIQGVKKAPDPGSGSATLGQKWPSSEQLSSPLNKTRTSI